VCGVDPACLADAYELRATLEERAAQLAVPCRAEDLLTLSRALIDLERAAVAGDALGYSGAIQNFHRRIIMMSGNREFLRVWDFQHWGIRTRVAAQHALHDLVNFIDGHQAALKALTVGDGIGAGRHLRGLIERLLHAHGTLSASPSTDH
jgi:DNA-binding GntR family transcriptional regulator